MATLYDINQTLLECVDLETGEIVSSDALSELQMVWADKIEGIALWYKNLLADAEAYEKEKNSFAQKQKSAESRAESLKRFLADNLSGDKFKTTRVNISYRKSASVEVDDVFSLPEDFVSYKMPEPKKTELKMAIKNGQQINGVRLIECQNIQIR